MIDDSVHAFWNFTYTYSSDASKADSSNPCGPGPYSSESIVLGGIAINITDEAGSSGILDNPVPAQLPSTPTGFLYTPDETSSESGTSSTTSAMPSNTSSGAHSYRSNSVGTLLRIVIGLSLSHLVTTF
jgi:hypothetical protein